MKSDLNKMKQIILEDYRCHLLIVLKAIQEESFNYNWFITNIEAYPNDNEISNLINNKEYLFLSNKEVIDLLEKEDFQWIWAVFSAIPTKYKLNDIIINNLPYADGNSSIYQTPTIQHYLAEIEILAIDGNLIQVTSKNNTIIEELKR